MAQDMANYGQSTSFDPKQYELKKKKLAAKSANMDSANTPPAKEQPAMSESTTAGLGSAAQRMAKGGSAADAASSGLMTAGISSGNPYLIAAGAGLGVLSGASKRKREEEQARINAEMDRRNKMMVALSSLGSGVGSIG